MKYKLPSLIVLALVSCSLLCSSCAGVFTKDDAKEVGAVIVKESLVIAAQAASGVKVDPKIASTQLGLKVANLALAKATANMTSAASSELVNAEAERIVNGALSHAQSQIPQIATSPQETLVAQIVAAESSEKSLEALSVPGGGN
jgi:hypothetical protein